MDEASEHTEMLQPEPAHALGGLLGVRVPDLEHGDGLPLLWHWVYLLNRVAQADLGPDGHPLRGTLAAFPGLGRRRMWAGGRVSASGLLRCGQPATRRSRVLSINDKRGRSGPLTFIVIEHQILQHDRVIIDEQQDIVYRDPAVRADPALASFAGPEIQPSAGEWAIEVSPTLLFRFSALTYNAHRIHYDRDYARNVEGYPGLLVQGPLQALAMAEAARRAEPGIGHWGERQHFEYRLASPLYDHQGMVVGATREQDVIVTGVRDIRGRRTATGTLRGAGR
jgi:3-methylfumaryl-CoA hydratase